jgi:hypothetical protein
VRTLLHGLSVRVTADREGLVVLVANAEEYERSVRQLEPLQADPGTIGATTSVAVVTAGEPAVGTAGPALDQVR